MSSASFHDYTSIPRSPDLSRLSPPGKSRRSSARPSESRPYQGSPSHIELLPHTDGHSTLGVANGSLITFPIPLRPSRLPTLSPGPDPNLNTPPRSAISHSYISYTPNQDVLHPQKLLNHRPITHRPGLSPNSGHQVHSPQLLESSKLSSPSTRHVAINSHNARLTTSNQVFSNISDLAAHYGIPQFLPVAPRTTPRRINDPSEASSSTQTDNLSSSDFANLCSNYLVMLSEKPDDHGATDVRVEDMAPVEAVPGVTEADAIRSLMDVLNATPELQSNDLNEYLTSPLIDSPLDDDLLTTPALGSDIHADILTSPLMDYGPDSFGGDYPSLFEEFNQTLFQQPKPPHELPFPNPPDFNGMYSLDTPNTPMLDSPGTAPLDRPVAPLPKRKSNATGTRKNITVESLVPIEAPTQTRKYLTPSSTSRKELPAIFRRKRARGSGAADEEDELGEEGAPTVSEQEQIATKRRQNTVAARRSRARKLEHLQDLQSKMEQYESEMNMWKQRALTCQAVLRSHKIQCDQAKEQW